MAASLSGSAHHHGSRRNALRFSALRLLTDHQKREASRRREDLGEPLREIARSYNVSHSTISRPTQSGPISKLPICR